MSTQVIDHISRDYNPILNFPATENNLSWSFTEEGDGEIYSISTVNIATLSIGGSNVPLPFSTPISVTNAVGYSVAITKINNGQTASVTINARRVTNKTVSISVPDFGAHDGRYIYAVSGLSNLMLKIDSNDLLRSTYLGAGNWSTTAIKSTISLPALPSGGVWTRHHLRQNGDMLFLGTVVPNSDLYGCIIDASDLVWDITKTTQNSYTLLCSNSIGNGGSISASCYDFINNIIVYKAHSSIIYFCRLNNSLPNRGTFNSFLANINSKYNFITNRFIAYTGYDINTDTHNGFYYVNSFNLPNALLNSYGYILKMQNNSYKWLSIWNNSGNFIGNINGSGGANNNSYSGFSVDQLRNIVISYPNINSFCCFDLTIGNQIGLAFDLTNMASDSTGYTYMCCSPFTGYHFLIGKGTSGKKRLIVLDPTDFRNTSPEVGYLDLDYEIDCVMTNQLG